MKKIFTLTCMALMAFGTMNAKLIFHESFDNPNGEVGQLSAGPTNSEEFFDGNNYEQTRWWTALGSSNYIQVAEGSMSFAGYQTQPMGNKAYLWSTGADDVRSFASSNVTSGKIYMSAIINVEAVKQKADPDYFISLCDHANSYFLGRIYAKSVKEGDSWVGFKLGIAKNNESATYIRYSEDVLEPGKDYLVVIEYEFVSGDQNDIARLYINPTSETSVATIECVQDTVTGGGMKQGASNQKDAGIYGIFGAFLRQGTNTPKVYVDEIKVATAWSDIWVEKSGDEPAEKDEVENIAALKAYAPFQTVLLKSKPVVVNIINGVLAVQDESGAVLIDDFYEYRLLDGANIGDQLENVSLTMTEDKDFINGLPTARLSFKTTPAIDHEAHSVVPFEVSLAEVAKYGPAVVQLREVSFESGALKKFDVGLIAIKQDAAAADLLVPNECDIIGEDIPASADVLCVVYQNTEDDVRVRISASADVTNRKSSEQGLESVSKESRAKSQKVIRNGQMVILRDGKEFNVLGTEL